VTFVQAFLRKLLILLGVLAMALWLTPHLIKLDSRKTSLLTRFNQQIGGELDIHHVNLALIPHVALKLEGISLAARDSEKNLIPIGDADRGERRLSLRTALSPQKHVRLQLPRARFMIQYLPYGWNLKPLLPRPYVRKGVEPSRESRAETAGAGERSSSPDQVLRPGDIPFIPTPTPELPSVLEKIQFDGIVADQATITIIPQRGSKLELEASHVNVYLDRDGWNIRGQILKKPFTPVAAALAGCEGLHTVSAEDVFISLRRDFIEVRHWRISNSENSWEGSIQWNGNLNLHTASSGVAGALPGDACGNSWKAAKGELYREVHHFF